jgi:C4-dicarboxylate-specific signal transduction histidine kinase
MENQQEPGKAENLFKNFGKRVDQFMSELNEAGDRLHKEFEGRFEELRQSAEKLKKEAEDKEKWKEVEASLKRAGEELKQAFNSAFKKREQ